MDVFVAFSQTTTNDFLGSMQTFGDVRKVALSQAMDYYHMSVEQRQSVEWLAKNHLDYLAKWFQLDISNCKSILSFARVGVTKETQFLFVTLLCIRYEGIKGFVLDNRCVFLGKKGGKNLINPARRGNDIHGERVLTAPCLHSALKHPLEQ